MVAFIEYVVQHFYFVIIVVGILVSMLNKSRKNAPRGGRMPDFGGGPGPLRPGPQGQRQSGQERQRSEFDPDREPVQPEYPRSDRQQGDRNPLPSGQMNRQMPRQPQRRQSPEAQPSAEWPDSQMSTFPSPEDDSALPTVRSESRTSSRSGSRERPIAAFERALESVSAGSSSGPYEQSVDTMSVRAGKPFRMPEGEELRRAFVLAEVLGPPRSRRPLRRP